MKTLKLISILLMAAMFSSCLKKGADRGPYYLHYLFLSIQDASGADLVKELGLHELNSVDFVPPYQGGYLSINPELYTLEAVYPEEFMEPTWGINHEPDAFVEKPVVLHPCLEYVIVEGVYYLVFFPHISYGRHEGTPPAPEITYRLTCPTIFGDDEVHQIITYWKPPHQTFNIHQKCYRIVYSDIDISDITVDKYDHLYYATIQLEK